VTDKPDDTKGREKLEAHLAFVEDNGYGEVVIKVANHIIVDVSSTPSWNLIKEEKQKRP